MPTHSVARDVFMYLLVLVVLTMSTMSLGALLFDFVNIYLPDPIRPVCAYMGDGCAQAVNVELSILIVAFPVLLWAWRAIQKDVRANPDKAELKVRKWMLYLTLFVAGIAAIVDLITLIGSWLNGDLTLQIGLKVLAVLIIAGTTFLYFLRELSPGKGTGRQRFIAWAVIIVVLASIVAGVMTSEPWQARERANDSDRITSLQDIQSRIVTYWQNNERLPDTLTTLKDPLGVPLPKDPEEATGHAGYEYARTGERSFALCATFSTETLGGVAVGESRPAAVYGEDENWSHGAGRVCFERTIDPSLYPVKEQL